MSEISAVDLEIVAGRPLLLTVDTNGQKAQEWVEQHSADIERLVQSNGALLLRGLNILSSKQFGKVLTAAFNGPLLNYEYRSTPRTGLRGNVYTATEYPPSEVIPQHSENAYANKWAMRLGLFCLIPAQTGGETPLADNREVFQRIPAAIRDKFAEKKIMYVRNYGEIDLPWSEVFQTSEHSEVEQYCRDNNLEFEWTDNNGLRTSQVNPAIAEHPHTKEKVWFNQAHLFHISSLGEEAKTNLVSAYGEDKVPRNAYYGDGSQIEEDVLDLIRQAYQDATIAFSWQKNDLLLVDNMLYTHGRRPFSGSRQVLVGMAQEHGWTI